MNNKYKSLKSPKDYLKAHLNVAWLRPECALWDAIASTKISKYKIIPPSLDLGCGNGLFGFITAGGNFSIDYDWYINANPEGFWENKDIYDACNNNKIEQYIIEKPKYTFSYGLDYKSNLLSQAKSTGVYENLIIHDANLKLPFKDGTFNTIFSNILYWLKNLKRSLKEIYRIMSEDGTALLCIPNVKFKDYCFTYQWKEKGSELLRLLNRGRSECIHYLATYEEISIIAKDIGFNVIDHSYYLSPIILQIWDIGLRPLSPVLIKMANELSMEKRRTIKAEWIETTMKFLLPLYEMDNESKAEGGFHIFVLKK